MNNERLQTERENAKQNNELQNEFNKSRRRRTLKLEEIRKERTKRKKNVGRNKLSKSTQKQSNPPNFKPKEVSLQREKAKAKRKNRMEETKKRREFLQNERTQHLKSVSGENRQKRLKKRSLKVKRNKEMIRRLTYSIQLAARLELALNATHEFREYKAKVQLENNAARIITRAIRTYNFERYRRRIKGAITTISMILVMKIKLWRRSRRTAAARKVVSFLLALNNENTRSGGCLELIVKAKKWRLYRQKIILLQRIFRQRFRTINAQVALIDRQWIQEQHDRTQKYIDKEYEQSLQCTKTENMKIEAMNRTRRLVKLTSLPKISTPTREDIEKKVMEGSDILSINHIVPSEIRRGFIKSFLRYLRHNHQKMLELYKEQVRNYELELREIQAQRAVLVSFSGSKIANTWVQNELSERKLKALGVSSKPIRPVLSVLLGPIALNKLISTGEIYVDKMRASWSNVLHAPVDLHFDGKDVFLVHLKEKGHM